MSARKMSSRFDFGPVSDCPPVSAVLRLPASAVLVRKNGIEFRAQNPIPLWTELTVAMEPVGHGKRLECGGVVVGCDGNRRTGYVVLLLFTNLPRQSRALLDSLDMR